ncbi:hypothetical protein P691DRAFT_765610 [Macrolepiota fuliginosa MF-IS2]|uniref:Uncharacterized protein n=1 Tax=Macrolepiota fuliginosa MF-IS2 TaxID=1400762 RepID=A0A9P6BWM4_9AGAR|nr:hypothetical protein P691DRAFT_765610 [Macrolepiota fuliginosa MF-IS2]
MTIPASWLFIKIMDVPFFKPGTTEPPTGTKLATQLTHSPIPLDFIEHSCFMCNSPKANSRTYWINLTDSQRGTHTSSVISHRLFLNRANCLIKGAKAHTAHPFLTSYHHLPNWDLGVEHSQEYTLWLINRELNLINMGFSPVQPTLSPSTPIEVDNNNDDTLEFEELSPTGELTNAIAAFGLWFEDNNIADNEHPSLVDNIRHLAMMFSLIPVPYHCSPCVHLHQDDTPPCHHPHAEDIPSPPPCLRPHWDNEDIPMEPPAPTCAFSEAASQTPAPSHEVTMPPPPPTTAAILSAAAASIPPAGPHGHASCTGAAAKNLNPAAPLFVHGPPHAPVQPLAQAQQPISSKCLKCPFFAMCGPSHCQFFIEALTIPPNTSLPTLVITANRALSCAKSTLKVDSAHLSPHGITCATATIPSTSNLNIVEATLSGRLLRAHISIPVS